MEMHIKKLLTSRTVVNEGLTDFTLLDLDMVFMCKIFVLPRVTVCE